jgi:hypothetical protein
MAVLAACISLSAAPANTNTPTGSRSGRQSIEVAEMHLKLPIDTNSLAVALQTVKNEESKSATFFDRNKDALNFLIQTVGVVGGLVGVFFLAYQIRLSVEVQKLANLQMLTTAHREVWTLLLEHDDLHRIFDVKADIAGKPISEKERLAVNFLIQHLNTSYHLDQAKMIRNMGDLQSDVKEFFSFPIPRAVWNELKDYLDKDLVKFVDTTLADNSLNSPHSPLLLRLLRLS